LRTVILKINDKNQAINTKKSCAICW